LLGGRIENAKKWIHIIAENKGSPKKKKVGDKELAKKR